MYLDVGGIDGPGQQQNTDQKNSCHTHSHPTILQLVLLLMGKEGGILVGLAVKLGEEGITKDCECR